MKGGEGGGDLEHHSSRPRTFNSVREEKRFVHMCLHVPEPMTDTGKSSQGERPNQIQNQDGLWATFHSGHWKPKGKGGWVDIGQPAPQGLNLAHLVSQRPANITPQATQARRG